MPGYGDSFPKLLLVTPVADTEARLFTALHQLGIAAALGGRAASGQKLFGARIVSDPAPEWAAVGRFVRVIVAFGPDARATADAVTSTGDRSVTVLSCRPLDDPDLTDAALAELLASAQQSAGLSWGCGGSGR